MTNFKNYSLKPDIAYFSLSLTGNLITFFDVVHKALAFCFLFIAGCNKMFMYLQSIKIPVLYTGLD